MNINGDMKTEYHVFGAKLVLCFRYMKIEVMEVVWTMLTICHAARRQRKIEDPNSNLKRSC